MARQLTIRVGLVVAALLVPAVIALVERPTNRAEGLLAMTVGLLALALATYHARTAGFRVETDGSLSTLGLRTHHVPVEGREALRFESWSVAHRGDDRFHRLVVVADGRAIHLTRWTLDDRRRRILEDRLAGAGLTWSE